VSKALEIGDNAANLVAEMKELNMLMSPLLKKHVRAEASTVSRSVALCAPLLLIVALAVACSNRASSPTSAPVNGGAPPLTIGQVAGTWTLVSIAPAGEAPQTVPAGASYDLTLDGSRASMKADCNRCNGSLAVGGQTLTIGPALACTRAACPTMAFENAYVALIAGDSVATIDNSSLTLTSTRGVVRYRREISTPN